MKELAFPNTNSFAQFKKNWWKVSLGGIAYLLRHPLAGPPVIRPRLAFALKKRSLTVPVKTPEGFFLKNNSELLVYTQIFVEQNLKYKRMVNEFRYYPNPVVIDVGYNCGFVTKWLNSINNTANFYGVEVLQQNIDRAGEMDRDPDTAWFLNGCGPVRPRPILPAVQVFHRAAWNKSGERITINVGDNVTTSQCDGVRDSFTIETLALDDIPATQNGPIFLVKIDTDGSNIKILEGASSVLPRVKWLLIEEEPGVEQWMKVHYPEFRKHRLTTMDLIYERAG